MAGTIEVSPGVTWSAASWLFEWVLTLVAGLVDDQELKCDLTTTVEENLGWLSIPQLGPRQAASVAEAIRGSLVAAAERDLVGRLRDPAEVLRHLQDLKTLLGAAEGTSGA